MTNKIGMNILVVNAGSSSLRLSIINFCDGKPYEVVSQRFETRYNLAEVSLEAFFSQHEKIKIDVIAHRVVHGGERFFNPCRINDAILADIESLSPLAPMHNPIAVNLIKKCQRFFEKGIINIAVFDTMFFHHLPEVSRYYALPKDLSAHWHLRRYGFHGLAHQSMLEQWCEHNPEAVNAAKIISIQLGSGCSITAIKAGQAIDTSMGFSPLQGLVMATRCGDIDPGLLLYLQHQVGMSDTELDELLNRKSGLLGLSGISADIRELLASEDKQAKLAIDIFCYQIKKYIGAYFVILGGVDAIIFGGGIGENSSVIRDKISNDLACLNIYIDAEKNQHQTSNDFKFHAERSKAELWVVPVKEELLIARLACQFMHQSVA